MNEKLQEEAMVMRREITYGDKKSGRFIEKRRTHVHVLCLKCNKCGKEDEMIIGYDETDEEAEVQVPTGTWNGWKLDGCEICALCQMGKKSKKGRYHIKN